MPPHVSLPGGQHSIDILSAELEFKPEERSKADELFGKGLPPLATPDCLPYLFGVSHRLIWLMQINPARFYRIYKVPKSSGGTRQIEAPRRFLKVIQRWINENICLKGNLPDCVMGFAKNRSIFDNGKAHSSNRNLMVVDIKEFFPSIKFPQVEAVFGELGFNDPVTHQLAALCCLDGRLPQGAPTSPAISNLVFRSVDLQLLDLASQLGCTYTRYADDLAFSGSMKFGKEHVSDVGKILNNSGFGLNTKKTRIVGQGGRQIVAGLVVNEKVLPPRVTRRIWRAKFDRAGKHPGEFADDADRLFGIAAFVKQYAPTLAERYREIAKTVLESKPKHTEPS